MYRIYRQGPVRYTAQWARQIKCAVSLLLLQMLWSLAPCVRVTADTFPAGGHASARPEYVNIASVFVPDRDNVCKRRDEQE
jgi:hypothetical protein